MVPTACPKAVPATRKNSARNVIFIMVFASFQCNRSNRDTNLKPYESLAYEKANWVRARLCAYRELAAWRKPAKAEKDSAFKVRSAGMVCRLGDRVARARPAIPYAKLLNSTSRKRLRTAAAQRVPIPEFNWHLNRDFRCGVLPFYGRGKKPQQRHHSVDYYGRSYRVGDLLVQAVVSWQAE